MPIDYEKILRERYINNRREVIELIESGDKKMHEKIDKHCMRYGFTSREKLIEEIKVSEHLPAYLAKAPKRQNTCENLAAEYIENLPGVSDFVHLPNKALYICNGGVFDADTKRKTGADTTAKSIDFRWVFCDKTFYAYHKYTGEPGGSQGDAYHDLKAFINETNKTTLKDARFIAIADGDYYDTNDSQAGMTRIENLKQVANNSKGVYACRICDLVDVMNSACNMNLKDGSA